MVNPVLAEALRLHAAGWDVLPGKGKRPVGKWGGRDRKLEDRLTEAQVRAAFSKRPTPTLLVALGSHQCVIDLDPQNDPSVMARLAPDLQALTKCATTPSGGLHAHCLTSTPVRTSHPLPGVDILGGGSVVGMPPSPGRTWTGIAARHAAKDVGAWARAWLLEHGYEPTRDDKAGEWLQAEEIPKARRNDGLVALGGPLRKFGFTGDNLHAVLCALNELRCKPPLTGPELQEIMEISKSLSRYTPDPADFDGYTIHTLNPHEEPPPLGWLIGEGRSGLLPAEGVTLLHGSGGQGKSYVALAALLAVLTGTDFLSGGGGIPTVQGPVIYVDWERRGDIFRRRLRALTRVLEQGRKLRVPPVRYIDAQEPLHKMVEPLRAHIIAEQARLVVIDSLTISLLGADVKEAHEIIPRMYALNDLPAAILVIDHQRKLQAGENPRNVDAFGSVFKGNVASMVWQVAKDNRQFDPDGMDFTLHHRKNNFDASPEDIPVRLDFQWQGERLTHVGLTRRTKTTPQDEIVNTLQAAGETPYTLARIVEVSGVPETTARRLLAELVVGDLVKKLDGGTGPGNAALYTWLGPDAEPELGDTNAQS